MKNLYPIIYLFCFILFISCANKEADKNMKSFLSSLNKFRKNCSNIPGKIKNKINKKEEILGFPYHKIDYIFQHFLRVNNKTYKQKVICDDIKNLIIIFFGIPKKFFYLEFYKNDNIKIRNFELQNTKIYPRSFDHSFKTNKGIFGAWSLPKNKIVYIIYDTSNTNFHFYDLIEKKIFKTLVKNINGNNPLNYIYDNKFAYSNDEDLNLYIWDFEKDITKNIDLSKSIDIDKSSFHIRKITPFSKNNIILSIELKYKIYLLFLNLEKENDGSNFFLFNPVKDFIRNNKNYQFEEQDIDEICLSRLNSNQICILYKFNCDFGCFNFPELLAIWDIKKQKFIGELTYEDEEEELSNISFCSENRIFLKKSDSIDLTNIETGKTTKAIESPNTIVFRNQA